MTALVVRADANRLPLPDNSVDLIVTSPPYFALRSYTDGGEHYAGQIGDEPTPQQFLASLWAVTRECLRVLKPEGSLFVNLGDKYAQGSERSRNGLSGGTITGGKPIRDRQTLTLGRRDNTVPQKSLIGIPWRYALGCIDDLGLILRAELIWSKPNGLPESVTDRVRRSHEQWFHFTQQPRYFSAVDEIREPHAVANERTPYRVAASNKPNNRGASMASAGGHLGELAANPLGKLPGSVWEIATSPLTVPEDLGVDHFAAFPSRWPERLIRGWSPNGICVECGEGRRPVAPVIGTGGPVRRAHRHLPGYSDPAGVGQRDVRREITGYECRCTEDSCAAGISGGSSTAIGDSPAGSATHAADAPPTRPAVVLDPFGGTGTTALVASALGRVGISVDLSHDYSRLARWRTTDRGERARVLGVPKPPTEVVGQADLFTEPAA